MNLVRNATIKLYQLTIATVAIETGVQKDICHQWCLMRRNVWFPC